MYAYERVLSRTIVYVKRTDSLHSQKNGDLTILIPTVLFALPYLDLVKISTVLKGDRSI